MTKQVILTGIRANNDLTIGNYFGAIMPIIDMAKKHSDEYQINMFIPDLHSFTTPIDHSVLKEQILHNAKVFVAAGLPLNKDSINLYRQSFIPAHSELTVILNSFTGMGEMSRMTQFKDKSGMQDLETRISDRLDDMERTENTGDRSKTEFIFLRKLLSDMRAGKSTSLGLFDYPVLMAADILLYGARYIPVGDDQTQHLEFTRDIAERMNSKFGDLFTVPEPVKKQHEFFGKDQGLRIMDLMTPTKKMSKSDDSGKGVIFLSDDPAEAAKKVMGATTDDKRKINYDPETQPGISNLLEILALLQNRPLQDVISEYEGQTEYGQFKAIVAAEVEKFLTDFQANLANVDESTVLDKLQRSEANVNEIASSTLLRVQKAVGLR